MLGLLLIYWVGKSFYDLAKKYNRSGWLYAILAIVTYYGSQFLCGILLGIILVFTNQEIDRGMEIGLNLGGIALGAGFTFLLYKLLQRNWERKGVVEKRDDLIDSL